MAGGDGERAAEAREADGGRVDREHGGARCDRARCRLDALAGQPRHRGALVERDAAVEQARAQPEREPGRLHGRRRAQRQSAAEDGGDADVVDGPGVQQLSLVHAGGGERVRERAPGIVLGGRRRDLELARRREPGVHALGLAPAPDRADRVGRDAADLERALAPEPPLEIGEAVPERADEAAVPPARPVAANVRLDDRHRGARLGEVPRRPEAEVAAADDRDVRARSRPASGGLGSTGPASSSHHPWRVCRTGRSYVCPAARREAERLTFHPELRQKEDRR